MTKQISDRDWQALSAYLDNQLPAGRASQLEKRLQEQPELRAAMDELRRTRWLLRNQPRMRAPRNFTLTPEMVGARRQPPRSLFPVFSLTSALASLLLVIVLVGDLLIGASPLAGIQAQAPAAPEAAALEAEPKALTPSPEEAIALLEAATQESLEPGVEAIEPAEDSTRSMAPFEPTEAVMGEAGAYPSPLAEEPAMMMAPPGTTEENAVQETLEATATSSPTTLPTVEPLPEIAAAQEGELAHASQPVPAPPSFWTSWRLLEAALALIALLSGALALYWRRFSG